MRHPLTESLGQKVAAFLESKEGCTVTQLKPTLEGIVLELRDVFGFQYTIEMKATARINNELHKEPSIVDFYQKSANSL